MQSFSSFEHPFTYINPISGVYDYLTEEEQSTIIALTIVLGIFTAGLAVFPTLYDLSAHYRKESIKQIIHKSGNASVSKADQHMKAFVEALDMQNVHAGISIAKTKLKPSKEKVTALALVQKDGDNFECLSEAMRDDDEVTIKAVTKGGPHHPIKHASEGMKNNKKVALATASKDAEDYEYFSQSIQADKEIALTAINKIYTNDLLLYLPNDNNKSQLVDYYFAKLEKVFGLVSQHFSSEDNDLNSAYTKVKKA